MKKLLGICAFIILTSFTVIEKPKALQNGHYLVELDKEYKELGLNDFDFTLENEKIIMKIGDKYETLEIVWVDENSFIVKGYTEPLNPNETIKKAMGDSKIVFEIAKQEGNKYYFTLGEKFDKHPIFSGKFIKTK
jgi:arginine utilization protein RocB